MRVRYVGDIAIVSNDSMGPGEIIDETVGPQPQGLVDQGVRKLVYDLTGVDFLSSTQLGMLLTLDRRLAGTQSRLRVCCPESELRKVFEITKLDGLVLVFATLDEALNSF